LVSFSTLAVGKNELPAAGTILEFFSLHSAIATGLAQRSTVVNGN